MAGNRKKAEAMILAFIKDMDTSGYNLEQYKTILKGMSDKDFDNWMKKIRDGEQTLVMFSPLYNSSGITTENNLEVSKKYNIPLFEKLVFTNEEGIPDHKSTIEYLVVDLPIRRQSQNVVKKASIPENNKVIDSLTYQPTGDSKGAAISYPELQVLIGMGLDNSINELIRYRGGDKGGFSAYNAMINRYGSVNQKTIKDYTTGVESTKTLKSILLAQHLVMKD